MDRIKSKRIDDEAFVHVNWIWPFDKIELQSVRRSIIAALIWQHVIFKILIAVPLQRQRIVPKVPKWLSQKPDYHKARRLLVISYMGFFRSPTFNSPKCCGCSMPLCSMSSHSNPFLPSEIITKLKKQKTARSLTHCLQGKRHTPDTSSRGRTYRIG
jgi:hypothetical protein